MDMVVESCARNLEALDVRMRALLASPKHEPHMYGSYADSMRKLQSAAFAAAVARRALETPGGTGRAEAELVGALVVPGLVKDPDEWQRLMTEHLARRDAATRD